MAYIHKEILIADIEQRIKNADGIVRDWIEQFNNNAGLGKKFNMNQVRYWQGYSEGLYTLMWELKHPESTMDEEE
jgi:hypothetical protein